MVSRLAIMAMMVTLCMLNGQLPFPISFQAQSVEANDDVFRIDNPHRAQDTSVRITGDADFVSQGWPGNGTPDEPYLIEGLEITRSDYPAILIEDTTAHFVIAECLIWAGGQQYGIALRNITSGSMDGCEIKNGGVLIQEGTNCSFNRISYESETFSILNCSRCNLTESFAHGSCLLVKNSQTCRISGNRISTRYGLSIYQSDDIEMRRNWFEGSGVLIDSWNGTGFSFLNRKSSSLRFDDNIVNGKDLGYFENVSHTDIRGADFGQVILVGCYATEVIGASMKSQENGLVIPTNVGIQLLGCLDSNISDVIVEHCSLFGFISFKSNETMIASSDFSDNGKDGVYIEDAHHVNISDCTIRDNEGHGVRLTRVNCSILDDNLIHGNRAGIVLSSCSWNNLTENRVLGSFGYGIDIDSNSFNNTLYGNEIGWNKGGNARDLQGEWNSWDDCVSRGNAWSDYDGSGVYKFYNNAIDHYPTRLEGGINDAIISLPILELITIGCIIGGVYVALRRKRA